MAPQINPEKASGIDATQCPHVTVTLLPIILERLGAICGHDTTGSCGFLPGPVYLCPQDSVCFTRPPAQVRAAGRVVPSQPVACGLVLTETMAVAMALAHSSVWLAGEDVSVGLTGSFS